MQSQLLMSASGFASLTASVAELNGKHDWFRDPARADADNDGPYLTVIDDFYADPWKVRELALKLPFVTYVPPPAELVGEEVAERFRWRTGTWRSTAFVVFLGERIKHPFFGERYNPPELRTEIEELLGERVDPDTWDTLGDYWNGAFHLLSAERKPGAIHHHYKPGDVEPRGWSGVVYLSPDAPPSAGTSIWREKKSGLCVSRYGAKFDIDASNFELAYQVENRFNRLVLFRENVLHRSECGFGEGTAARLTQTFFFRAIRT